MHPQQPIQQLVCCHTASAVSRARGRSARHAASLNDAGHSRSQITIQLSNGLQAAAAGRLTMFKSRYFVPANSTEQPFFFERQPDVKVGADGSFTVTVEPDAHVTLSTLQGMSKGTPPTPAASAPFPLPHSDDFEGYANDTMAKYFSDMVRVSPATIRAPCGTAEA